MSGLAGVSGRPINVGHPVSGRFRARENLMNSWMGEKIGEKFGGFCGWKLGKSGE